MGILKSIVNFLRLLKRIASREITAGVTTAGAAAAENTKSAISNRTIKNSGLSIRSNAVRPEGHRELSSAPVINQS